MADLEELVRVGIANCTQAELRDMVRYATADEIVRLWRIRKSTSIAVPPMFYSHTYHVVRVSPYQRPNPGDGGPTVTVTYVGAYWHRYGEQYQVPNAELRRGFSALHALNALPTTCVVPPPAHGVLLASFVGRGQGNAAGSRQCDRVVLLKQPVAAFGQAYRISPLSVIIDEACVVSADRNSVRGCELLGCAFAAPRLYYCASCCRGMPYMVCRECDGLVTGCETLRTHAWRPDLLAGSSVPLCLWDAFNDFRANEAQQRSGLRAARRREFYDWSAYYCRINDEPAPDVKATVRERVISLE